MKYKDGVEIRTPDLASTKIAKLFDQHSTSNNDDFVAKIKQKFYRSTTKKIQNMFVLKLKRKKEKKLKLSRSLTSKKYNNKKTTPVTRFFTHQSSSHEIQ